MYTKGAGGPSQIQQLQQRARELAERREAPPAEAPEEKKGGWLSGSSEPKPNKNPATKETLEKAIKILGKTKDGEALKKLLEKKVIMSCDRDAAAKAFEKVEGSLDDDDRAIVEAGLGYANALGFFQTEDEKQFDAQLKKTEEAGKKAWQEMMSEMEK